MERKKLLAAVTRALKIAKVRESRIALLCDNDWSRKLKLLPPNILRNKLKYIIDQEVQNFANACIRKRSNRSRDDSAGPSSAGVQTGRGTTYIHIESEKKKFYQRFQTEGAEYALKIKDLPSNENVNDWLQGAVGEICRLLVENRNPNDFIGLSMSSQHFKKPVWMSFRPISQFDREELWELLDRVIQSNESFEIDDTLKLSVAFVQVPRGSGRIRLTHEDVYKKSILRISNRDNLCFPRSVVTGLAHAARGQLRSGELHDYWKKIRKTNSSVQTNQARILVNEANLIIPESGCGIVEIQIIQKRLARFGVALIVYLFSTFGKGGDPYFDGTKEVSNLGLAVLYTVRIMYFEESRHYRPILSLTGASATPRFCELCNKGYRDSTRHKCVKKCSKCLFAPPCQQDGARLDCTKCNRSFANIQCLQNHTEISYIFKNRSVCDAIKICRNCLKTVRDDVKEHFCGYAYCKICCKKQPFNHLCYMRVIKDAPKRSEFLFVFFDLETRVGATVHEPNLCVAQQICSSCIYIDDTTQKCDACGKREFIFKAEPIREFVEFLLSKKVYKKVIVVSHYGSGFDNQFIFKYLVEMKTYRVKPTVIMRGTKIILMNFENLKFVDSFNYFHLPLCALPSAYGFAEMSKGWFPHHFNTIENADYVGPMPPKEAYGLDSMKSSERASFLDWYEKQIKEKYLFDFAKEIVSYCVQDVTILRKACLVFRQMFLACNDVCPFSECSTIASTCLRVFRKKYLKENVVGIVPNGGYRMTDTQSVKAIQWLSWMEKVLDRKIHSTVRGRELRLPENVKVDGFCSSRDGKEASIVLQYHGCYYHGCSLCFKFNRNKPFMNSLETMEDKYERTLRISQKIVDAGYDLIEVWECQVDREIEKNKEMQKFMCSEKPAVPLDPRDAFYGGRVENAVKYLKRDLKYYDVRSLYPYVCKNGEFPVGHPKIYIGQECNEIAVSSLSGLVKCEILPPRRLYFPVLPVRMHGKLLFPLCRTCCEESSERDCNHENEADRAFVGTWVSNELQVAIEHGYKMLRIFEIWQYQTTKYDPNTGQGGIFAGYIDEFFALKTEASGYPCDCVTEEQKDSYVKAMEAKEGIKLNKANIENNPGKRSVAKLLLNTLWGKFGQNENLGKTEVVTDPKQLFDMLTNPDIEINSWLPVNEEVIYLGWSHRKEAARVSGLTNVVIAAYTTAQARLKLYSYLSALGRRCAYFDTDSIIFYSTGSVGEYEPPVGPLLGDLACELTVFGVGSRITEFVSGGPKFYAFQVEKANGERVYVCKVKGIRLNYKTATRVNFETLKELICNDGDPIVVSCAGIRRTAHHDVVNKDETKICRTVYKKRRYVDLDQSFPFGYANV